MAQEPPAVPTIQVGSSGEAEAGLGVGWGAWPAPLLQGALPTLPTHGPCTLLTSP